MITNLCNKISTKCVDFFLMGRGRVSMIFVTLWSEFRVEFHYTYFCVCGLRTVLQCDDTRWHCPGVQLFGRLVRAPPKKNKQQVKVNFKRKKGKKKWKSKSTTTSFQFELAPGCALPAQHDAGWKFLDFKNPVPKKKKNKKCCFVCSTNWTESLHIHLSPKGQRQSKERKKNGSKSELRGSFDDIRYSLMMVFSLFYYWVIFYRSMAPGERTNDCRWRTCFCIIRKKEKKRYGIV